MSNDHRSPYGPRFSTNGSWWNDFQHYEFGNDHSDPDIQGVKDLAKSQGVDIHKASFERITYVYHDYLRGKRR